MMVKILQFLYSVKGTLVTVKIIADKLDMDEKQVLSILKLLKGYEYVTSDKNNLWTITQAGVERLNRL